MSFVPVRRAALLLSLALLPCLASSALVLDWYPDGKSILLRSQRASAMRRYDRFFKVAATGGFEEMLPLPTGGYATFSADAKKIAFVSPSYDNRTWKRYKGGNAPEIWT